MSGKRPSSIFLISIHKTRDFEWQTAHTKGCQENRCEVARYLIFARFFLHYFGLRRCSLFFFFLVSIVSPLFITEDSLSGVASWEGHSRSWVGFGLKSSAQVSLSRDLQLRLLMCSLPPVLETKYKDNKREMAKTGKAPGQLRMLCIFSSSHPPSQPHSTCISLITCPHLFDRPSKEDLLVVGLYVRCPFRFNHPRLSPFYCFRKGKRKL